MQLTCKISLSSAYSLKAWPKCFKITTLRRLKFGISNLIEHGKDAFLVMTTDGVSFVMNDQEIVDAGCRCTSPTEAANFIAEQALHYACDDNASTIVIPFGAWGKILHSPKVNYSSFGRELCRSNRH